MAGQQMGAHGGCSGGHAVRTEDLRAHAPGDERRACGCAGPRERGQDVRAWAWARVVCRRDAFRREGVPGGAARAVYVTLGGSSRWGAREGRISAGRAGAVALAAGGSAGCDA